QYIDVSCLIPVCHIANPTWKGHTVRQSSLADLGLQRGAFSPLPQYHEIPPGKAICKAGKSGNQPVKALDVMQAANSQQHLAAIFRGQQYVGTRCRNRPLNSIGTTRESGV